MESEPEGESSSRNGNGGRKARPKIEVRFEAPPDDPPMDLPALSAAGLNLPTPADLAAALLQITNLDQLHGLREQVALWEEAQKRYRMAIEVVVDVAIVRLRLERKMGQELAQTVHSGGHGSKSHNATSIRGGSSAGLPEFIDKHRARRYRQVASVPEEEFEAYLAHRKLEGQPPTTNSLLSSLTKKRRRRILGKTKAPESAATPEPPAAAGALHPVQASAAILDAIDRVTDVDLVVGDVTAWPEAQHADPDTLRTNQLKGNVLIAECPDPAEWLPKLAAARSNAVVAQVIVLLPLEPCAAWFKEIERGGWACCFAQGVVIAYLGNRTDAFRLAFDALGAVLKGCGSRLG